MNCSKAFHPRWMFSVLGGGDGIPVRILLPSLVVREGEWRGVLLMLDFLAFVPVSWQDYCIIKKEIVDFLPCLSLGILEDVECV